MIAAEGARARAAPRRARTWCRSRRRPSRSGPAGIRRYGAVFGRRNGSGGVPIATGCRTDPSTPIRPSTRCDASSRPRIGSRPFGVLCNVTSCHECRRVEAPFSPGAGRDDRAGARRRRAHDLGREPVPLDGHCLEEIGEHAGPPAASSRRSEPGAPGHPEYRCNSQLSGRLTKSSPPSVRTPASSALERLASGLVTWPSRPTAEPHHGRQSEGSRSPGSQRPPSCKPVVVRIVELGADLYPNGKHDHARTASWSARSRSWLTPCGPRPAGVAPASMSCEPDHDSKGGYMKAERLDGQPTGLQRRVPGLVTMRTYQAALAALRPRGRRRAGGDPGPPGHGLRRAGRAARR